MFSINEMFLASLLAIATAVAAPTLKRIVVAPIRQVRLTKHFIARETKSIGLRGSPLGGIIPLRWAAFSYDAGVPGLARNAKWEHSYDRTIVDQANFGSILLPPFRGKHAHRRSFNIREAAWHK